MANTYLSKTFGTPTNNIKWTWSAWIKRSKVTGSQQRLFFAVNGSNYTTIQFDDEQKLVWFNEISGTDMQLITNREFRDTNAWMHLVFVYDSANSTAADRQIIYINGVRVTSFATENTAGSNVTTAINQAVVHNIASGPGAANFYDGLMSHIHFSDGYTYAASTFGSTDSTTGEWKINTAPSITMGNNGFTILKDGNTITDQSSNSNDFSLGGGTLTKTEDCPSNVFATLNPLSYQVASQMSAPPTNGNTTLVSGSGGAWGTLISTIGATTGKYYFEAKCIANGNNCIVGAVDINDNRSNSSAEWYIGQSSTGQGYQNNGSASNGGASYGATYTNGDIIGVAMDLDNYKLYFRKNNGAWENSGNPESGSTGTGAMSLTAGTTYAFALTGHASTTWYSNFGNGYFSTGAVASAGTNASGIGIFEYDVPTGYTALSTKGLNL